MKRRWRVVATGLLVVLAAALALGIVFVHDLGGRLEAELLIFGDRVWVTVDVGHRRVLLLLLIPGVLVWAALSLRPWRGEGRSGEEDGSV